MFTFEYIYVYTKHIYISFLNIIYVLYIVIYLYKTYLGHVNTIQQIHLKIKNIIVLVIYFYIYILYLHIFDDSCILWNRI